MRNSRTAASYPLLMGSLALAAVSSGASTARAQAGAERSDSCLQHWTYAVPSEMAYRTTLPVIDSKGDVYWAENAFPSERTLSVGLVAARDGRTRWRRRLSTGESGRALQVSVTLLTDDLLAVAFESRVQGRSTSDGRLVWSRDLHADLAPELRQAGLARGKLQPGITARLGRSFITAAAASYTDAWLTATTFDGKLRWKTRIAGPVARMAFDGERLYALFSESRSGEEVIALDSTGRVVALPAPRPGSGFGVGWRAVHGDELVFDSDLVITANVGSPAVNCPAFSPSCHPAPLMLTVAGFGAGLERWHLAHTVGAMRAWGLLLLSDRSVLLVDNERVGHISPAGILTPLCAFAVSDHGEVAGLTHGDLVVAYPRRITAYTLPGAPQLATTGWVERGGGPGKGWAVRIGP